MRSFNTHPDIRQHYRKAHTAEATRADAGRDVERPWTGHERYLMTNLKLDNEDDADIPSEALQRGREDVERFRESADYRSLL